MRIFFALELNADSRIAVKRLTDTAREYCRGRWVRDANYHITLRFLGEQPLGRIQQIKGMRLNHGLSAFPYRIGAIGRFRKARGDILWVGVSQGEDRLAALKQALDKGLAAVGFPPEERPYHPHITLARDVTWEGSFHNLQAQALSIGETAGAITLMESRSTAEGVRYIPLMRWELDNQ